MADTPESPRYAERVLDPLQVKAARGLLRWSQTKLAQQAKVALNTVKGFESGEVDARASTLREIEKALVKAGVIFLDEGEAAPPGGIGVRLRK